MGFEFMFRDSDFQNVAPIVVKAIRAICKELENVQRFSASVDESLATIKHSVDMTNGRLDDTNQEIEGLRQSLDAHVSDTQLEFKARSEAEAQERQKKIMETQAEVEEQIGKLEKDVRTTTEQHGVTLKRHEGTLTKIDQRIVEEEQRTNNSVIILHEVEKKVQGSADAVEAMNVKFVHKLHETKDQMQEQIQRLENITKSTDLQDRLALLQKKLGEEQKDREVGDANIEGEISSMKNALGTAVDLAAKQMKTVNQASKNVDNIKQEVMDTIFNLRAELMSGTNIEFEKRVDPLHDNVDGIEKRLLGYDEAIHQLLTNLPSRIRHETNDINNRLTKAESKLSEWIADSPMPAHITEARLFSVEARIKQEEENRIGEQNAITSTLNTVVECIDHNTRMLETKADRRKTEKILDTKADKQGLFYGAITNRRPPPRTRPVVVKGKKGHLHYDPVDDELADDQNQPPQSAQSGRRPVRKKAFDDKRSRPATSVGLSGQNQFAPTPTLRGGRRAQASSALGNMPPMPMRPNTSPYVNDKGLDGTTPLPEDKWAERTADEIMLDAHVRSKRDTMSATSTMRTSRLVPTPAARTPQPMQGGVSPAMRAPR